MRIPGYGRIRVLLEELRARRFVASLDRSDHTVPAEVLLATAQKLEAILDENILPFWFPRCVDVRHGGYLCECSLSGDWKAVDEKSLVSQSRILWFVSRLINFGRTTEDNLRWARHGFAFLRDRLLDADNGGFFWEVDVQSGLPTKPDKHLYGQAFALYALSEFSLATGHDEARAMADQLFALLEEQAHDGVHGGYHEFFRRDWGEAGKAAPSYMGHPREVKQLNTHLHLLEAFTRYVNLADSDLGRLRIAELIQIQSHTVVTKEGGGSTDVFSSDWQRNLEGRSSRVTYGHDLENVWLLIEANRALGLSNTPLLEFYERLFLSAVRYGWDVTNLGFYSRGQLMRPADRSRKIWWTQAEALLCALHMYALTGQAMYFQIFEQTLSWIDRHQVDWSGGEWFEITNRSGTPSGAKAIDSNGRWKTPYHGGRAMIHCLELLDKLSGVSGPKPAEEVSRSQ